ncbi:hypothetical protein HDA45_000661 [Amycolatopsis umgeniensis]|uniref:Uncharacterized protein n=1 Tax=Amycolatopsis umgeniensis TaxID=336628 RepID=A0A841AWA3_9PSEU|nr:hypothetical protein [Amycolatopsis umgeniensis]
MGRFACYPSPSGRSVFVWTNTDLDILSIGSDPQLSVEQMKTWFEGSVGLK